MLSFAPTAAGRTFVLFKHLSAISADFDKSVGANNMPNWPVGPSPRATKASPPASCRTPGSIGYIEYGYAKSQNMPMAMLENKSGKFVAATPRPGRPRSRRRRCRTT